MYVATHWPGIERYKPEGGWPVPELETFMHIGVYLGWVATWWWLLSAGGRQVSPAAIRWLVLGGTAYAIFDEASQAVVDRVPAVDDFLANLVGLVAAVIILRTWQCRRSSRKPR